MPSSSPIGVFDSGFGGLSALHAIRAALPAEDLIYCADHARLPWGERGSEEVRERSRLIADLLIADGAKVVVIACNTATAAAADSLRSGLDVPVIGMEPAVKPAAAATRSGVIGVLGTGGTLASARFSGLLQRFADGLHVVTRPSPELVELVETTVPGDPRRREAVEKAVAPLLSEGADVLVLGCTHFAFLRDEIETAVGDRAVLIDTGPAVASHLAVRLTEQGLACSSGRSGSERFLTSGDPAVLDDVLDKLWTGARFEPLVPERTAGGKG